MTGLPLVLREPAREPLLAVWIDGRPVRAVHKPTAIASGPRWKDPQGRTWVLLDQVVPGTRPDPKWKAWRDEVVPGIRLELADDPDWTGPITGPVLAGVVAVWPRPKAPKRTFTLDGVERPYPYPQPWGVDRVPYVGKPDHDQVVKAGVDAVMHARGLVDDVLVVGYAGGISRWYAAVGEEAHVEVRLWAAR